MARWEPNACERLEKAALELYRERGYDETAVADIAARAGLTERTFFRHFADKREVLFRGASMLQEFLAGQIAAMPAAMAPIDAVAAALEATSPVFEDRRSFAHARQAVIASNSALQERELIKLASLGTAMAGALRDRGVPHATATLAAETGIAIFKLAFEQFVKDDQKRDLGHHVRAGLEELKAVTAGARPSAPRKREAPASGAKRTARPRR